jgi:hypothetical protein
MVNLLLGGDMFLNLLFKESRRHGWALTLHWVLDALERTIGKERAAKLPKVS